MCAPFDIISNITDDSFSDPTPHLTFTFFYLLLHYTETAYRFS